jgi:hypothetical protein
MRCERKKDRVEVNPELLAAASAQAEISFPPFLFFLPFEILVCSLMWCGLLSVGFWALDLTLART